MDILTGLIIIIVFYLWFLFMDRFFKSCSHYGYIQFLKETGIEIRPFQFGWSTTAFNKIFQKWGSIQPKLLHYWFSSGIIASLILLPVSIYILLLAFCRNFMPSRSNEESLIQPIIPGINLPASELGYFSITLLLSSVLHELGHAIAAVHDDVTLINVGVNVILVLPVAYVNLNSDKLFSLNPVKQLKILCAGIWHNLLLAFLAYLLYFSLPYLFSPLYDIGNGVIVVKGQQKGAVFGPKGLAALDRIIEVNECVVRDQDAWFDCLARLEGQKPAFCVLGDLVHTLDESVHLKHAGNGAFSCCRAENEGKLCFEFLDGKDGVLDIPPYACLPGREAVESASNYCSSHPHTCPNKSFCFRPILGNGTGLYRIKRAAGNDVIYMGPGSDLGVIAVSSYVPKFAFLSNQIADVVSKSVRYFIVFSMGLAIVNVLPCMFTDGQFIANTLFHAAFSKHLRTTQIKFISGLLTGSFTFILVLHCVIVLWSHFH